LDDLCFSSATAFQILMNAAADPAATTAAQWQEVDTTLASVSIVAWLIHADSRAVPSGVRVRLLLDQLDLSASAWRRIVSLRDLAARQGSLLQDEWDDL